MAETPLPPDSPEETPPTPQPGDDLLSSIATEDFLTSAVGGLGGGPTDPAADPTLPATDPDEGAPRTDKEPAYSLDSVERDSLAQELCRQLDEYDQQIEPRRKRLDRCMDNYKMVVDEERTGRQPFSAKLCSELTKSTVDQAVARLAGMVINTRPFIQVKPVDPENPSTPDPTELAEAAERFLEVYAERELEIRKLLPLKIQTAVQQGDAITYDTWEERTERIYYYNDDGDLDFEDITVGSIRCYPIHYRDFYLWPLGIQSWQKDYQLVGHRGPKLTEAAYKAQLEEWGLSQADILELTAHGHSSDPELDRQRESDDIDVGAWTDETFRITEIWYNGAVGSLPLGKHKIYLDREHQKVLRAGPNPLHCAEHPYRPIRYKRKFNFAFSEGVAEELIQPQAIASTLDNMELDNAKVTGNHVVFYDENNAPQGFFQDIYPGARYGVNGNPKDSVMVTALGGSIDSLETAKQANYRRADRVAGFPPVLLGSGDPTMKSGADASSTMALISEAGRKPGQIDQTIKEDISAEFAFWLELLAQYAPNGFARGMVSPKTALPLEAMKFIPPRGRLKNKLRIEVTAPSPSSNREVQKQHILLLNQMADNYLVFIERHGMEIYSAEGKQQQLLDFKRQIFEIKTKLWEKLLELHEIPGMIPFLPRLEEPTPDEVQIDQLRQQLVQVTQQLQSIGAELIVHKAAIELLETGQAGDIPTALKMASDQLREQMNDQQQNPQGPPPALQALAGGAQ